MPAAPDLPKPASPPPAPASLLANLRDGVESSFAVQQIQTAAPQGLERKNALLESSLADNTGAQLSTTYLLNQRKALSDESERLRREVGQLKRDLHDANARIAATNSKSKQENEEDDYRYDGKNGKYHEQYYK